MREITVDDRVEMNGRKGVVKGVAKYYGKGRDYAEVLWEDRKTTFEPVDAIKVTDEKSDS